MADRPVDWYLEAVPDGAAQFWMWDDEFDIPAGALHSPAVYVAVRHLMRQVAALCGRNVPGRPALDVTWRHRTVEGVATRAEMSATTIYAWLAGTRWPTLDGLLQVFAATDHEVTVRLVERRQRAQLRLWLHHPARRPHGGGLRTGVHKSEAELRGRSTRTEDGDEADQAG